MELNNNKKTIVFHSNFSKSLTGFGRNAKCLLKYLYSTNKYNIIEFCSGKQEGDPELSKMPWICEGTIPLNRNRFIQPPNNSPEAFEFARRETNYGAARIDEIIQKYKPDIYFGDEDIWAMKDYWNKNWWSKITPILHTTLDSIPIHPLAFQAVEKTKYFFVKASFAEKELKKNGYNNVQTIPDIIDDKDFYPLDKDKKLELRKKNNIPENAFIIGFVFRNQLRKSVPNLLDGFKIFINENPTIDTYLILHTDWRERGWNIPQLIWDKFAPKKTEIETQEEYLKRANEELKNIRKRILTTYYCNHCHNYILQPYTGDDKNCPFCKSEKSFNCCGPTAGVTENQLNEIYNVMDIVCHPVTSGGLELPPQEAKLAGIPVLVNNYSCCSDILGEHSGAWELDYSVYYEQTSNFAKASTSSYSIAKQLKKFYYLASPKKEEMKKDARNYALERYIPEVVCKKWEQILDSIPKTTWNFNIEQNFNPDYPFPNVENDVEFIKDLYKNILDREVKETDSDVIYWLNQLK